MARRSADNSKDRMNTEKPTTKWTSKKQKIAEQFSSGINDDNINIVNSLHNQHDEDGRTNTRSAQHTQ